MLGKGDWRAHRQELQHLLQGRDKRQPERRRSFENPLVDQTLCLKEHAGTATAYRVSSTAMCSVAETRGTAAD